MPGKSVQFKTDGTGRDLSIAVLLNDFDPFPSYAITVLSDSGNSNFFKLGRQAPAFPFYAKDSMTFYSAKSQDLILNDQGTAATIYFDISGPMEPAAERVTVYSPAGQGGP